MPITYSHSQSDADIYAGQKRTTEAQLKKLYSRRVELLAQRESDPYCPSGEGWKRELPAVNLLIGAKEKEHRDQTRNWQSASGQVDAGPPALSGGHYWKGPDHE